MGNQGSFGHGVIGGESGEMSSRPDRARATLSGGTETRSGGTETHSRADRSGRAGAALDRGGGLGPRI